ncbi:phosphotransferase [Amycolatopsis acidicola]|uniref:Phosphotransferase n=1 Tax=Amycolatopsis acidicola TaxID=2596893 RepID=A0A5N0VBV0_9PSEU|nr:phosphotransferase [Amycolatopsis acidicola]KAA9162102.1 phosphotransferase [Amycolatopsis acidicola]
MAFHTSRSRAPVRTRRNGRAAGRTAPRVARFSRRSRRRARRRAAPDSRLRRGFPRVRRSGASHRFASPDTPAQALHGDAHASNLLMTPDGPRWLDFEDTWHGPVAWDVACLAMRSPESLRGYPDPPDEDLLAAYSRLRRLFAACWQFVVARRFPERLAGAREAVDEYFRLS